MTRSRDYCSPYERLDGVTPAEHPYRRIVLLKRADGTDRNSPRDMPHYDGRGASKALLLALDRLKGPMSTRALTFHMMALEQVEREQGVRESERAA